MFRLIIICPQSLSGSGVYCFPFVQPSGTSNPLCNFSRGHFEEYFSEIILNFGPVVKEKMSLKDILFLTLVASLFSGAEWFVQFSKGHYEEYFLEIILKLAQWLRGCYLKIFLSLAWWPILFNRT